MCCADPDDQVAHAVAHQPGVDLVVGEHREIGARAGRHQIEVAAVDLDDDHPHLAVAVREFCATAPARLCSPEQAAASAVGGVGLRCRLGDAQAVGGQHDHVPVCGTPSARSLSIQSMLAWRCMRYSPSSDGSLCGWTGSVAGPARRLNASHISPAGAGCAPAVRGGSCAEPRRGAGTPARANRAWRTERSASPLRQPVPRPSDLGGVLRGVAGRRPRSSVGLGGAQRGGASPGSRDGRGTVVIRRRGDEHDRAYAAVRGGAQLDLEAVLAGQPADDGQAEPRASRPGRPGRCPTGLGHARSTRCRTSSVRPTPPSSISMAMPDCTSTAVTCTGVCGGE